MNLSFVLTSMLAMFHGGFETWGIGEFLIALIVVCAAVAVAWIVMTQVFQTTPPAWLIKIFWIVIAAFVAIFAIRLLLSM